MPPFVLDVDPGQPQAGGELRGGQQGREAFTERDAQRRILDRKHLAVTPHRGLAQSEVAGAQLLRGLLEVVAGEQRRSAIAQVEHRSRLVRPVTACAVELGEWHGRS